MSKKQIKKYLSLKRLSAFAGLSVLIAVRLSGGSYAQNISQAYGSDQSLLRGMIVGLDKIDSTKVEALGASRIDEIFGVVINPNDSPLTLSEGEKNIFVASSGRYDVLVSDQEGQINPGDFISPSGLAGIGMITTDNQSHVVGRAVTGFNGSDGVISTNNVKDNAGTVKQVRISRVRVDIGITKNPAAKNAPGAPEFLGRIGQAIAGKPVQPARLYISLAIFLAGAVTAISVMYIGVKTSITAIGRNPLSKHSIYKGLGGVSVASVAIFIISVFAVYLLLKV